MSNYAGADWLKRQLDALHRMNPKKNPEVTISELGVRVADFLGEWKRGIYHIEQDRLYKADWTNNHHIQVTIWCTDLATYDFDDLTRLVFLAHEMALRVQLEPATHHYLRLTFYPRSNEAPEKYKWHPTLDEAVSLFRQSRLEEQPA